MDTPTPYVTRISEISTPDVQPRAEPSVDTDGLTHTLSSKLVTLQLLTVTPCPEKSMPSVLSAHTMGTGGVRRHAGSNQGCAATWGGTAAARAARSKGSPAASRAARDYFREHTNTHV
jgi:hypothetical protein